MDLNEPKRIPYEKALAEYGIDPDDLDDLIELEAEGAIPACCEAGCMVEPDGTCPHGHPSVFLAMGVI